MAWTQNVTLTKSPKCPVVADPALPRGLFGVTDSVIHSPVVIGEDHISCH